MTIHVRWESGRQEKAIEHAGIDPKDIDVVIYIGEEHKEYPLWTACIKLQEEIGAHRAWSFDAALRCGTTIMALKLAKSLMVSDPSIQTILLAGGYRNVDFIDYENERTRFMFNLAAGGGAMLLQKGSEKEPAARNGYHHGRFLFRRCRRHCRRNKEPNDEGELGDRAL